MPTPACVGDQSNLGKGLNEFRTFRRQNDVAGQRKVCPSPRRNPIHGANNRAGKVANLFDQGRIKSAHGCAQIGWSCHLRRIAIPQILTCAKSTTRTRQQNRPYRCIACAVQTIPQGKVHFFIKTVQPIRTVQGDFKPSVVVDTLDCFTHRHEAPFIKVRLIVA